MRQARRYLSSVCLFFMMSGVWSAQAEELVAVYGSHDGPPFAFVQDGELTGGIIRDIFDALEPLLAVDVVYRDFPRKRIGRLLLEGRADVYLITNPQWHANADQFQWSVPLFEERGQLVVRKDSGLEIKSVSDLQGKRIGTIRGYIYPGLMEAFETEAVIREDTDNLYANFRRLELGYIDSLIDSDIMISYYLKKVPDGSRFRTEPLIISRHNIRAMLSPEASVPREAFNRAILTLQENGTMHKILTRYD